MLYLTIIFLTIIFEAALRAAARSASPGGTSVPGRKIHRRERLDSRAATVITLNAQRQNER
jgi:hypothetical protein